MVNWKSSIIVLVLALAFFNFFINEQKEHFEFDISSETLKYHSNWTSSY